MVHSLIIKLLANFKKYNDMNYHHDYYIIFTTDIYFRF